MIDGDEYEDEDAREEGKDALLRGVKSGTSTWERKNRGSSGMSASRREGFESDALYPRKLAIIRGRHLDWEVDGYVSKRCDI